MNTVIVITAVNYAKGLAAALNEIDELFGTNFNDFRIIEFIQDYGAKRFGVDMDAFNAVEVCWPAMLCNQYRFILPIGTHEDRAVVLWNRMTGYWEALPGNLLPSFVREALPDGSAVAA